MAVLVDLVVEAPQEPEKIRMIRQTAWAMAVMVDRMAAMVFQAAKVTMARTVLPARAKELRPESLGRPLATCMLAVAVEPAIMATVLAAQAAVVMHTHLASTAKMALSTPVVVAVVAAIRLALAALALWSLETIGRCQQHELCYR